MSTSETSLTPPYSCGLEGHKPPWQAMGEVALPCLSTHKLSICEVQGWGCQARQVHGARTPQNAMDSGERTPQAPIDAQTSSLAITIEIQGWLTDPIRSLLLPAHTCLGSGVVYYRQMLQLGPYYL